MCNYFKQNSLSSNTYMLNLNEKFFLSLLIMKTYDQFNWMKFCKQLFRSKLRRQLTPESIILGYQSSQFRFSYIIWQVVSYSQFISNNKSYFLIYLLSHFDFPWESSESPKCLNYVIRTITLKYSPTLSHSGASKSTVPKNVFLDFNTLALVLNRDSDQDSR